MKNFATSTVVTAPSPATSGLSLTVTTGQGALFEAGRAVLWPSGSPTSTNAELVTIQSVTGDTITLRGRAAEGTTAKSVATGWLISQGLTVAEWKAQTLVWSAGDPQWGITGDGTTDDRPAIQAFMNAASVGGAAGCWFPAPIATYLLASNTISNGGYPDLTTTGALTFALDVPPGLSVWGPGSNECSFTVTTAANAMMIRSTLGAVATVTANGTQGQTIFTVDSTASFAVGDTVATHYAQNASDPQEARWTILAKVKAIASSTSMELDTPAEWAMDTTTSLAVNRRFIKVTAVAEKMTFRGFHIQGGSSIRHGIGAMYGRHIQFQDLTGFDIGSGVLNLQFLDNCAARDIYVYQSGAYGNPSKGRAISLSNVTNFTIDNFTADKCDAAALYLESYCRGIRVNGWRINNRSTSRSVAYLIFCGLGCDLMSSELTVQGWNAASVAADSVVSYGPSDGRATFHNTTLYMQINQIRAFPVYAATGLLRCFDTSGNLITFNMNKIEHTPVQITLTDGGTKTAWMRAGLVVAISAAVPSGVTSAGLTTFNSARVGTGSVSIPWVANREVTVEGWLGSTLYPVYSKWDQSLRIQAIVAAAAGLTGTVLAVNTFTVVPDGYQTVVDEPTSGTPQVGRFGPNYAV